MKIFIDTNILISASLNFNSVPYQAYLKAVTYPNHACLCDQNIDEFKKVYIRKFPNKTASLERFLSLIITSIEIVPTPLTDISDEFLIRDIKDRPILRAAAKSKSDILVTGDKDFLESKVQVPKILTASEFLKI